MQIQSQIWNNTSDWVKSSLSTGGGLAIIDCSITRLLDCWMFCWSTWVGPGPGCLWGQHFWKVRDCISRTTRRCCNMQPASNLGYALSQFQPETAISTFFLPLLPLCLIIYAQNFWFYVGNLWPIYTLHSFRFIGSHRVGDSLPLQYIKIQFKCQKMSQRSQLCGCFKVSPDWLKPHLPLPFVFPFSTLD